MGLGILFGTVVNLLGVFPGTAMVGELLLDYLVNGVLFLVGETFLRLLQVVVVPLVMVSLITGTAALDDVRQLGRIGVKTVVLYMGTTVVAVSFALTVALLIKPGSGLTLAMEGEFEPRASQPLTQMLIELIPRNIFGAMAQGSMIPIIVFSIMFGIAVALSDSPGKRVLGLFQDFNAVVMKLVGMVLLLAPIGVFALIGRTFANEGFAAFIPLLKFVTLTLAALVVYAFTFYPAMLKLMSGLDPRPLLRKVREAQLFAFSTASSNATIPVALRTLQHKLGVHQSVASFTTPLGATLNMDGTAIMQGIATIFIAQVYGIDLGIGELLMIVFAATLAAIGTAGVPGAGIVMLSMILLQAGLPVQGIALIIGVDRILDMTRTAVNMTGDFVIGCIVAKGEGRIDLDVYHDPSAGTDVDIGEMAAPEASGKGERRVS